MTRAFPLTAVVTLMLGACSGSESPRPAPTPLAGDPEKAATPQEAAVMVHVALAEDADPAVEAWARALAAAIEAGHGNLALAATPEEAAAVVRIDSVETGADVDVEPEGEGEVTVMRGALVVGESARAFNLSYRGDTRPQAEALARNLRRFAAEGAAADAAQEGAEEPAAEAEDAEADQG